MTKPLDQNTLADMNALALRLIDAAERNDVKELSSIFESDAVIWHNTDGLTVTIADNFAPSAKLTATVPRRRYEEVKITPFTGGYVQQHRLVGETIDGKPFVLPACAIMHVRDGKIIRIEEYFDSAPLIQIGLDAWLPAG
jgi:ketosteroid isomerase-like protein